MSVEEQVKDIVAKIAHIDKGIMSRESTFKEMKADSLDIVQALQHAVALKDHEAVHEGGIGGHVKEQAVQADQAQHRQRVRAGQPANQFSTQ